MRITLKQSEIQKALLAFVAQSGIGGDAINTAQVVFTKGRKGNGLTAEVVIGEDPVEVQAEADVADAEGFANIAATWRKIAAAEKGHEERYRKLQKRVEEGTVFSREEDTYWQCRECGHIHYGKEALKACPTCAHPQAFFEEMKTNY